MRSYDHRKRILDAGGPRAAALRLKLRVAKQRQRAARAAREGIPHPGVDRVLVERATPPEFMPRVCRVASRLA